MIPWPKVINYTRVSSQQGWRTHPIKGTRKYHGGTDLAAPEGNNVHAMARGKVVKVGWDGDGFGRYVVVQHRNGYFTIYAHLQKNGAKVEVGDNVADGEVIGLSGNTGGSTGPHLHLELVKAKSLGEVFKKENKMDPQSVGDLEEYIDANPNEKGNNDKSNEKKKDKSKSSNKWDEFSLKEMWERYQEMSKYWEERINNMDKRPEKTIDEQKPSNNENNN